MQKKRTESAFFPERSVIMKKKWFICIAALLCIVLLFTGCPKIDEPGNGSGSGGSTGNTGGSGSNTDPLIVYEKNGKFAKAIWGKWTRIDNGQIYTISADTISCDNSWSTPNYEKVEKESENVLAITEGGSTYRLFRQAGGTRSFTAKVAGFVDSDSRATNGDGTEQTGLSNVKVSRKSKDIASDTDVVISDANGIVTFEDVVAGEEQILTVRKSNGTEVTVEVTPQFDGDDCGTIPIVESGYSFKTTYTIGNGSWLSNSIEYCYGNDFQDYNLTLNFKNIGDATCATAAWELICNDPELNLSSNSGMLSSIAAGNTKSANLTVSYGNLNEFYKDVDVIVKVTNSKLRKVWLDQITLRFYQLPVSIDIQSYSVDGSGRLNGFVVCPDGKAKYFSSDWGGTSSLLMPYKVGGTEEENKYTVVFSATSDTDEMAYSLSAGYADRPIAYYDFDTFFTSGTVTERFDFVDSFEGSTGNNSERTATVIDDPFIQTRSYVQYGDIDYFTFDVTDCMFARIDSISIPKAGISAAGKKVSAIIKGANFKSPFENVQLSCSSNSIVSSPNKMAYNDETMYVDLTIPANPGDFTVTASSEMGVKSSVFKVKNYTVTTGDVVLKDGTVVTTASLTDQQKQDAVGVICLNNAGAPFVLGKYNSYGNSESLIWAKNNSTGYNTTFDDIICHMIMIKNGEETYSDSYDVGDIFFTRDTDGSDNWAYICSVDPEGTADSVVAENYPAFNWVNQYATSYSLTGTDFEDGWYMPTVAELYVLYDNFGVLNDTLSLINGTCLFSNYYWSSSQSAFNFRYAWYVSMDDGYGRYDYKEDNKYVCCLRAFNE